jgi:hypothetical protein
LPLSRCTGKLAVDIGHTNELGRRDGPGEVTGMDPADPAESNDAETDPAARPPPTPVRVAPRRLFLPGVATISENQTPVKRDRTII